MKIDNITTLGALKRSGLSDQGLSKMNLRDNLITRYR